jgi:uncharacterized protein DUF6941
MPGEMGFATGPYVIIAAFCERVLDEKDNVISLIRVIDRFTVNAQGPEAPDALPPGTIETTLVVLLKRGEARGGQRFQVVVEYPDGSRREGPEVQINFPGGPESGANVVLPMQLPVESAGVYWAEVLVNGRLMARTPLSVVYEFMRGPVTGP